MTRNDANIKLFISIITLIILIGGVVFSFGTIMAKVTQNSATIAERKLSGKTVHNNVNRIVEMETRIEHFDGIHTYLYEKNKEQDKAVESIRIRARNLEKK